MGGRREGLLTAVPLPRMTFPQCRRLSGLKDHGAGLTKGKVLDGQFLWGLAVYKLAFEVSGGGHPQPGGKMDHSVSI